MRERDQRGEVCKCRPYRLSIVESLRSKISNNNHVGHPVAADRALVAEGVGGDDGTVIQKLEDNI